MKRKLIKLIFICLNIIWLLSTTMPSYAAQSSGDINLSTDIQSTLNLDLGIHQYTLGELTSGRPKKGDGGIIISVTTNTPNGYAISIQDNIPGNNSSMINDDHQAQIPDFSATIDNPQKWQMGDSVGVGFTLYSADTSKENKWGTGNTFNDLNNNYAGIPENSIPFHVSQYYKRGTDHSAISFSVDVSPDQKPGHYSGSVTVSVTPGFK